LHCAQAAKGGDLRNDVLEKNRVHSRREVLHDAHHGAERKSA